MSVNRILYKIPKNKILNEQNPELDKIPNGQNPKSGQNPEWKNLELDKILNGQNPELDKIQKNKIPNWKKSRIGISNPDKIPNRDFVHSGFCLIWDFVNSGFCPLRDFVFRDFVRKRCKPKHSSQDRKLLTLFVALVGTIDAALPAADSSGAPPPPPLLKPENYKKNLQQ